MSAFKEWFAENEDSLLESWSEHLSIMSMTQSLDHVVRLSNSDKAFEEFCESAFTDRVDEDGGKYE